MYLHTGADCWKPGMTSSAKLQILKRLNITHIRKMNSKSMLEISTVLAFMTFFMTFFL